MCRGRDRKKTNKKAHKLWKVANIGVLIAEWSSQGIRLVISGDAGRERLWLIAINVAGIKLRRIDGQRRHWTAKFGEFARIRDALEISKVNSKVLSNFEANLFAENNFKAVWNFFCSWNLSLLKESLKAFFSKFSSSQTELSGHNSFVRHLCSLDRQSWKLMELCGVLVSQPIRRIFVFLAFCVLRVMTLRLKK